MTRSIWSKAVGGFADAIVGRVTAALGACSSEPSVVRIFEKARMGDGWDQPAPKGGWQVSNEHLVFRAGLGNNGNLRHPPSMGTRGGQATATHKTLTLQGSTAGTGEFGGAIVDNSVGNTTAVTKAGTGTWTLSGANTYTGGTTVNAGTLL